MQIKANDYEAREIVKFIREWTGLTQENFGKSIYYSPRTIQSYESGESKIRLETFLEICNLHGVEVIICKK